MAQVSYPERFEAAMAFTKHWEGGYANVAGDRGGETNFGIADLRDGVADGMTDTDGDGRADARIKGLTFEQAKDIYYREYWLECACNRLAKPLDMAVFDAAVNHGPERALRWLSASGNVVGSYLDAREAFFHQIAKKPGQAKFLKGWLARLRALRVACRDVAA